MQYLGELFTICCLNVSPKADNSFSKVTMMSRVSVFIDVESGTSIAVFFLICTVLVYDEGRRRNDKLILQKFGGRHLCMKTVNCVACNWTHIYFSRATGDRLCRESLVACRLSRVTEHGLTRCGGSASTDMLRTLDFFFWGLFHK